MDLPLLPIGSGTVVTRVSMDHEGSSRPRRLRIHSFCLSSSARWCDAPSDRGARSSASRRRRRPLPIRQTPDWWSRPSPAARTDRWIKEQLAADAVERHKPELVDYVERHGGEIGQGEHAKHATDARRAVVLMDVIADSADVHAGGLRAREQACSTGSAPADRRRATMPAARSTQMPEV